VKTKLINEFKDRFNLSEEDWLGFLAEYQEKEKPLRNLCADYGVNYNAFRYLSYELGFKNVTKAERVESVLSLQKDLARECGKEYDVVHEMEKELELVVKKNRDLVRSITHTRDENNHLRKLMREEDREESLVNRLLHLFDSHLVSYQPNYDKFVFPKFDSYGVLNEGLCVVISDNHVGSVVKANEVPNNEYNYKIMENRILKVIDEVLKYPKQSKNLTVFSLLDDLLGIIHFGLHDSEEGFTKSILEVVDLYTKIYTILSKVYDNINVVTTLDNHSRMTEYVATRKKWDNFNVMAIKMAEKVLKSSGINNVTFNYTDHDYSFVEINGAGIIAFHGDSQRSFKTYSETSVSKLQDVSLNIFKKPFKHLVHGHFHRFMVIDNQYQGKCISNGSSVGDTTYGINSGFSSITPSQTIFFVDEKGDIEDIKAVVLSSIMS